MFNRYVIMIAILTSGRSVEAELEERVREMGVANAETGKEDFFITGSSVGSRLGDWKFLARLRVVYI